MVFSWSIKILLVMNYVQTTREVARVNKQAITYYVMVILNLVTKQYTISTLFIIDGGHEMTAVMLIISINLL